MGWANSKVVFDGGKGLILELNKIFLTIGGIDFLMGDNSNQVQSKNYRKWIYFLDDNYDKNPYYQKQIVKFVKNKDNTLLLDCKSYMQNKTVEDKLSGIFYNVCSDKSKVFFKRIENL